MFRRLSSRLSYRGLDALSSRRLPVTFTAASARVQYRTTHVPYSNIKNLQRNACLACLCSLGVSHGFKFHENGC